MSSTKFIAFWTPMVISILVYWHYELRNPTSLKWRDASEPKIVYVWFLSAVSFFLSLAAIIFVP
ncbi:hypothetical protein FHS21_006334 [Phyllobacterium trifolii]|uniref:Uncharacterized protein n=1 Tax=Phyllobacterium trifolii TaxID=300193 RepID=A0A839UH22_9HYPH|nr:hypothetical protein [Phyllobacterium trifolii]